MHWRRTLQCSCLENLGDGGAWWVAVYGVTQSRTQLKWLSSSSREDSQWSVSRVWLCNPMDSGPPGSSVHGILQARILEWVAMPSSKGSSWPLGIEPRVSYFCPSTVELPTILATRGLSYIYQYQFRRSVVSNSLQPQHTRPPCPSPTPGVHPNPCPLSRWCHPTISSSVIPFSSCPQSFPDQGPFKWVSSSHQFIYIDR